MQRDQITALILAGGKATRIEEGELRAVDPQLRALHNVNAPEDMSP